MRRANAERYAARLRQVPLAGRMALPIEPPGYRHIFNQYVVRVPERDRVRKQLAAAGVATEIYYPRPLHLQECFAHLGYRQGALPESERAAASTLALPIYGELAPVQQDAVVAALAGALRSSGPRAGAGESQA
jgi:dTDP-4-amino-4,6-dideoxygalactose transaminase